jgi:SPP1 family predicted phage head-tail adaptor
VIVGKLNKRIVLERMSTVSDGMGGTTGTVEDVREIWGRVQPLSGRRLFEAQQIDNTLTHEIEIRHQGFDLGQGYRIRYGERVFVPHSIINVDEDGFVFKVIASERR